MTKISPDKNFPRLFSTRPKISPDLLFPRPKVFPDFLSPAQYFNLFFLPRQKTGESNMSIGKMDAGDENNEDESPKSVIVLD